MIDEQKQYPLSTVRVFIQNKQGEIFFIKSPKDNGLYTVPGGHIELGETMIGAAAREVKEETGLSIKNVELFWIKESIKHPEERAESHYIVLMFKAELESEIFLPSLLDREASDYMWVKPEDGVKNERIKTVMREALEKYFIKTEKHGFFHRHLCEDCEKHKKEAEENKHNWMRALADYKNLQAETEKRRGEWAQMSEQQILEEFIPVYDHLRMAFAHHPPLQRGGEGEWENWAQGIEHIKKQFADILKSHGVEEIKTVGEKFDPAMHEAAGEEESKDVEPGTIIKEIMPGYKMGERVIRAARVIIAK